MGNGQEDMDPATAPDQAGQERLVGLPALVAADPSSSVAQRITSWLPSFKNTPKLAENLGKAWSRVVGSPAHVRALGAAEATTQALRDAAAARGAVLEALAEREAAGVAMRAIGRVAEEHVRAQHNLEATLPMAVEDAATRAKAGDATGEIDDDWLTRWMRLAESVSDPEMQELFAKILAGEAHRPGGFLPETLNDLSLMTRELASIFQRLCRLSIHDPGDDATYVLRGLGRADQPLEPFGVLYSHLLVMQTNGLLMSVGHSNITYDWTVPSLEVDYAGKAATLRSREGNLSGEHEIVIFSPAGYQLRQLIALEPVPEYTKALNEYLDKHGIDLIIEGEHA